MNQLSLNVLAITIFTLTLSSLLGPMINLNPAIPAAVAFIILGLMTVDTLQWDGRGSAFGLGVLASLSPQYRDRLLHHEAGHFLVAYLLDIPITGYTLNPWDALKAGQRGQAGVSFDDGAIATQLQQGTLSAQWVDRYCQMWMAGEGAEQLVYGSAEGGADDRQNLKLLLNRCLPLGSKDWQAKQKWSLLQAETLIKEHWSAYEALVSAMRQNLSVDDCMETIKQHQA